MTLLWIFNNKVSVNPTPLPAKHPFSRFISTSLAYIIMGNASQHSSEGKKRLKTYPEPGRLYLAGQRGSLSCRTCCLLSVSVLSPCLLVGPPPVIKHQGDAPPQRVSSAAELSESQRNAAANCLKSTLKLSVLPRNTKTTPDRSAAAYQKKRVSLRCLLTLLLLRGGGGAGELHASASASASWRICSRSKRPDKNKHRLVGRPFHMTPVPYLRVKHEPVAEPTSSEDTATASGQARCCLHER